MQHRQLGNSDLWVSPLCLGTMTWGEQNSESEAHQQLDYAIAQGINFIDTAEMYPVPPKAETQGLTERYLGTWLKKRGLRDQLVIATKVTGPGDWMAHIRQGPDLTSQHIRQAVDASLQRLQTDYIDLYQLHWPSRPTNYFGLLGYQVQPGEGVPLEETLSCLHELIKEGKIRHYGLSNETPWGTMKVLAMADQFAQSRGWQRPLTVQNPYNLLNRSYEVGMAEVSHRENIGLLAYSPLAFGVLSGKYLNGQQPEKGRITLYQRFSRYNGTQAEQATARYAALAEQWGMSPAAMALAFVTQQPFVVANIIGATTMDQLQENMRTANSMLPSELMAAIDEIHCEISNPCP